MSLGFDVVCNSRVFIYSDYSQFMLSGFMNCTVSETDHSHMGQPIRSLACSAKTISHGLMTSEEL